MGAAPEQRPRELPAEIDQTREDLSETRNAIEDRLRPANVAASAADSVKTAVSDKARELADSDPVQYVRANPIPTAMIGLGIAGLAWLVFGGRHADADRGYGSRRSSARRDWRVPAPYDEAQITTRTQSQLRRTWDESPLLIGATSAVVGLLIGLAVPETDRENQLMGEARDNIVGNVRQTVREKVGKVQDIATNAISDQVSR